MLTNPTTISERILFATARIEARGGDGATRATGSGFFFGFQFERGVVHVIVTNKHVVNGAVSIRTVIHVRNPDGSVRLKTVDLSIANRLDHPRSDVDVCLLPCSELFASTSDPGLITVLDESLIKADSTLLGLSAMEDAVMVGYPTGLYDEKHNFPILRRGTTASHPGVDFNGAPVGILDLACFPGSSGSPVLILNETAFGDKATGQLMHGARLWLLGIAFQIPVWNANGKIVMREIPAAVVPTSVTGIPIHITYYIKAKVLADFRSMIEARTS